MANRLSLQHWARAATSGLARRLTLVFLTMTTLFVAAVLMINLQTQRHLIDDRMQLNADHLATLITEVSLPGLLTNNPAALEVFIEELERRPDIERISLVDDMGWLLVSGHASQIAFLSAVDDPLISAALETRVRQQATDPDCLHVAEPIIVGDDLIAVAYFELSRTGSLAELRAVWLGNLAVGALFLALGGLLSSYVARKLTQPLASLKMATQRAAGGDLNQKITITSNDEFETLATAFNGMLDNLKASIQEIQRVAYEDKLTGIPNRSWLNQQLEQLTLQHTDTDTSFAVLFLDLDKFKAVNDTHGHHVGDLLLKAFSARLSKCLIDHGLHTIGVQIGDRKLVDIAKQEAILARLAGDEFTIVVPSEKAEALAQSIVTAMQKPLVLEGSRLTASTSVGIALFPVHAVTREHLLKCADVAMYQAKHAGRDTFQFYDHSNHMQLQKRSELERLIEKAIREDEFDMHLQPQFLVQENRVIGAEALIRWHHPQKGFIAPDTFLPVAASIGLLPAIGQIMVAKAIEASARINRHRNEGLTIAVNVAIEELNEEGFADMIADLLHKHGAQPQNLEIEITEGTAMAESGLVEAQVAKLRALGVSLAIDDFGMGYSNLGRLRAMAFETLKIDRSLVTGIGEDPASESLLTTILEMAEAIGADVVAEGIETQEQLAFLQGTSCACYQGYYGGKPMLAEHFIDWLAQSAQQDRSQQENTQQENRPPQVEQKLAS